MNIVLLYLLLLKGTITAFAGLASLPVHFVGRRMEHPRVRSVLQTAVIASAGLLLAAAIPLGRDGLTGPITWAIAVICFVLLLTTKIDALWMILGAAVVSLTASSIGLVAYI
jgi:chromate transporter